ncbi:hypothetical protein [Flagellimonas onchidii]|uniref:hypothetical protein n=1 Tax=Flagellimonas onchidii TaxID=2562684 RepID=UPI0010A682FC|nr:hypothetical protein [Allomuricauda onchidii]
MKPTKMILATWCIPFVAALIAVFLFCSVAASPIIGLVVIVRNWQDNRMRRDRIVRKYRSLKKRLGNGVD